MSREYAGLFYCVVFFRYIILALPNQVHYTVSGPGSDPPGAGWGSMLLWCFGSGSAVEPRISKVVFVRVLNQAFKGTDKGSLSSV